MKEKIAEIIWDNFDPNVSEMNIEEATDQILSLLKEEIKKSLLTDEEILEAENQFIEKAKSKHTELGRKFISKEITYDEYNKQSMEAWVGYYREITQAQLDKVLKALES